jgi:hypothetical protein
MLSRKVVYFFGVAETDLHTLHGFREHRDSKKALSSVFGFMLYFFIIFRRISETLIPLELGYFGGKLRGYKVSSSYMGRCLLTQ